MCKAHYFFIILYSNLYSKTYFVKELRLLGHRALRSIFPNTIRANKHFHKE